jgi:hypothetical protein
MKNFFSTYFESFIFLEKKANRKSKKININQFHLYLIAMSKNYIFSLEEKIKFNENQF